MEKTNGTIAKRTGSVSFQVKLTKQLNGGDTQTRVSITSPSIEIPESTSLKSTYPDQVGKSVVPDSSSSKVVEQEQAEELAVANHPKVFLHHPNLRRKNSIRFALENLKNPRRICVQVFYQDQSLNCVIVFS